MRRPQQEPAQGEIRLKLTSIGLNRGDLLYTQNRYFIKPSANSRIGFEGAGIVDKIGPNTETQFKQGDRVGICPMSFDVSTQGCLADYGIYAHESLILTPDNIDDNEAAAIWMAYFTAWGGLVDAGQLASNEACGHYCSIEFSRYCGYTNHEYARRKINCMH